MDRCRSVRIWRWKYLYLTVDSTGRTIDFMLGAKRDTKAAKLFVRSFKTARRMIKGFETVNMIRKGQIDGVGTGDIQGQLRFVNIRFRVAV